MTTYALAQHDDQDLVSALSALVTTGRATDARLLAHLAEVDARGLYLPAACASMHIYCVRVLCMSEDAAFKRITAARTARRFPAIFAAVADGRLHLSAVRMLSAHLTDDNVEELVAAASHRSKREIDEMLAERAPRPDARSLLEPMVSGPEVCAASLAPGRVAEVDAPATRATASFRAAPIFHPRVSWAVGSSSGS